MCTILTLSLYTFFRITSVVATLDRCILDTQALRSAAHTLARGQLKFQYTTSPAQARADKSSTATSIRKSSSSKRCQTHQCRPHSTQRRRFISTRRRKHSCPSRLESRATLGPCTTTTLLKRSSSRSSSSSHSSSSSSRKVMEPGRSRFSTFPPTTSLPVPGSSVRPRTSQQFTIPQQRPCTLAGKGGQRSTLYPSGTRKGALRRRLALLETPRPRSSTPPLLNLQPAHSRGALHAQPHLRSKKPTVSRPNRRRRRSERLKLLMG